jgi:hypothetical protein
MRIPVTIANGASLSGAAFIGGPERGLSLLKITMPADWTAASLTFQSCDTVDGTYQNYYAADGTEVTVQAADDRDIGIAAQDFAGVTYLKVRSGTSGAAVNQGAARTIYLVVGRVA